MDSHDEHPTNSINECAICYDPLNIITDIEITPCMHMFHRACYTEWLRRASTCPLCRSSLQREYINRPYISLASLDNMLPNLQPLPDIDNDTTAWGRIIVIPYISHFNEPEDNITQGGMRIGEMERYIINTVVSEPNGEQLDRNMIASLLAGDSITARTFVRH